MKKQSSTHNSQHETYVYILDSQTHKGFRLVIIGHRNMPIE